MGKYQVEKVLGGNMPLGAFEQEFEFISHAQIAVFDDIENDTARGVYFSDLDTLCHVIENGRTTLMEVRHNPTGNEYIITLRD